MVPCGWPHRVVRLRVAAKKLPAELRRETIAEKHSMLTTVVLAIQLAVVSSAAFSAIYEQSSGELIVVYASRFASIEKALESRSHSRWVDNPKVIRVENGTIVAMVHGEGGPCFNAVGAHLRSVLK